MFVRDEVVANKELAFIDPRNDSLYEHINLGSRCSALLIKDKRFRLDCRKFRVELCMQMKKKSLLMATVCFLC